MKLVEKAIGAINISLKMIFMNLDSNVIMQMH